MKGILCQYAAKSQAVSVACPASFISQTYPSSRPGWAACGGGVTGRRSAHQAVLDAVGQVEHGDDRQALVGLLQRSLVTAPDMAARGLGQLGGAAAEEDSPLCQHGHVAAGLADVLDDVGGEDHGAIDGQVDQQVAKADALFGIEPGGGLVDDQELADR